MNSDTRTNDELLDAARGGDESARAVLDREVLILRHFEELTNGEAAQVLGIKPAAAANRYVRALKRLNGVFQGMPGGFEETAG
jgi:hypothetical protein